MWVDRLRALRDDAHHATTEVLCRALAMTPRRPAVDRGLGGPGVVLAVVPHADDELSIAGTLALHRRRGDLVHIAYVSDGRGWPSHRPEPARARRRADEARAAAALLDARAELFALEEGCWPIHEAAPALTRLLDATRPTIVYAPSLVDFHPEHRRVASALARALTTHPSATVRCYQVMVPLGATLITRIVDTEETATVDALRDLYRREASVDAVLRLRRYETARWTGTTPSGLGTIEVFAELPAPTFRQLHASPTEPSPFRGVRPHSFSDPAAFVVGRGARRAFRGAIDEAARLSRAC